jgi:serine O-acetyltransferase
MMNSAVQDAATAAGDPSPAPARAGSNPQPCRTSFAETIRLIRSDIGFRCTYEHKPKSWKTALRMLRHPGVACVVRYRLQCFFCSNGLAPIGKFLKFLNLILYGVEIDERARIGGGLLIGHAVTILITADVTIGERCVLFHQNAIGQSPFHEPGRDCGPVVIGDEVAFGGGACAYGNIVIGDRCRIGVNSVVDRSFPADSSLFGVPARRIGRRPDE